ncbi:hypothetical protein Q1695_001203 [Nippostrongylus brasiliensis]|nr:hypothetical protein Q1695_001203 [Nippostrongylus brasiliensis]
MEIPVAGLLSASLGHQSLSVGCRRSQAYPKLVNLCAPAAEVEETPPQLEREAALEDELSISSETTAREHHFEEERPVIKPTFKALGDHMNYTAEPPVDPLPLPVCSSGTIRQISNDVGTPKTANTSQLTGVTPSRPQNSTGTYHITPKPDTKYPPMTLGGVIGIRRPRTTASQSTLNNNLTLDQLNPTLAEALAAMKNKTETAKQSTSHGTHNSSDGISGRRDSLPTRMSGPVKLEALTPLNSSYAGSSGCGHLVSFNGQTTEVPEEIRCHLCDYPMKLCIRKSKYKGEIREYAAYRCLRKGCQTFRSVRKVIEPDYPCARKRKTDDYYDGYNSSPYSIMRDAPNESMRLKLGESPLATDGSEGTLLYIPGKVTMDHVEQMQKFTISLLSSKTDSPAENVPRLLFAPVNMTADDIDAHLRTDEGQKKLQRILVNSPHQTPAKYSNEFPLSKPALSSTSSTAGAMPQLGQQASRLPIESQHLHFDIHLPVVISAEMSSVFLQYVIVLYLCGIPFTVFEVAAISCDCQSKEEIIKTENHLRLITRISALKLLPTVREVIYHTEAEKLYLLHRAKYDALRDLKSHYGNFLAQTDILPSLDALVASTQALLNDNRSQTFEEIHSIVNESVVSFHTNVLPSAFLCFALGTCRTASISYMKCMRNNVEQWTSFFGDEPLRMARNVADAVWRYRKIDAILQMLHNSLIIAEEGINTECVHRFNNVTNCPKCLPGNTVGYCRESCRFASFSCLKSLAESWEANIEELYKLTRKYDEGFSQLVQGVANGMQRLVEMKAPRLAKVVVSKCGPLLRDGADQAMHFAGSRLQKPKEIKPMTKELVANMRPLRKCWTQIADRMCTEASEAEFCWNGTDLVRPQLAADDLGMSIKDVRPRPKEAWLESSGQPYDTDDEDFINGAAGSGSGMPPSDDVDDTTFYTTAPAVTTTSTTTTIVTTVSPPSIQVEEMITATQVASNRAVQPDRSDVRPQYGMIIELTLATIYVNFTNAFDNPEVNEESVKLAQFAKDHVLEVPLKAINKTESHKELELLARAMPAFSEIEDLRGRPSAKVIRSSVFD